MKKAEFINISILFDDTEPLRAFKTLDGAKRGAEKHLTHTSKLNIKSIPMYGPWVVDDEGKPT